MSRYQYRELLIREDREWENAQVLQLIQEAFENENSAILADILRRRTEFISGLSLIAELNRALTGYVLLNPIQIQSGRRCIDTLWLEPVCVRPSYQGKGIGTALITHALERARKAGFESVFVTGALDYYSRFGFVEAKYVGIEPSLSVPSESFLILKLVEQSLPERGQLIFPQEIFD